MLLVDRVRGLVEADVESEWDASLVGSHHSAIAHYLSTGDHRRLLDLEGTRLYLKGEPYELETRTEAIEDIALAGDLGYDDIYVLE
jgi:hypothetical protein